MKNLKPLTIGLALVVLPALSNAQTYLTDISTRDASGQNVVNRLFLDAASTQLAPVGSRLWFVADTAGNGLPTFGGAVDPTLVLGPDDQIAFQDIVDGAIFGSNPGRYNRLGAGPIDITYANAHIYAFLWGNGSPMDEASVQGGNTFGVFDIGVRPPPVPGNANWFITADMNGSQFTVVPEPASAVYAGLGMLALALLRKRFGKKATV